MIVCLQKLFFLKVIKPIDRSEDLNLYILLHRRKYRATILHGSPYRASVPCKCRHVRISYRKYTCHGPKMEITRIILPVKDDHGTAAVQVRNFPCIPILSRREVYSRRVPTSITSRDPINVIFKIRKKYVLSPQCGNLCFQCSLGLFRQVSRMRACR